MTTFFGQRVDRTRSYSTHKFITYTNLSINQTNEKDRNQTDESNFFFYIYLPALWWTASRARSRPASAVSARCVRCRCVCEVRPGCPCPGWVDTNDEARRPWHHRRMPREHRHRPRRRGSARFPYLRRVCTRARARELPSRRYAIPWILGPDATAAAGCCCNAARRDVT